MWLSICGKIQCSYFPLEARLHDSSYTNVLPPMLIGFFFFVFFCFFFFAQVMTIPSTFLDFGILSMLAHACMRSILQPPLVRVQSFQFFLYSIILTMIRFLCSWVIISPWSHEIWCQDFVILCTYYRWVSQCEFNLKGGGGPNVAFSNSKIIYGWPNPPVGWTPYLKRCKEPKKDFLIMKRSNLLPIKWAPCFLFV